MFKIIGNLIIIITFITFTKLQNLQIKNLNSDPVLLLKHRECRIQTGTIKIIHPINLTEIETNVLLFSKVARETDSHLPMTQLILRKSRTLVNNFYQLKPIKSRRAKRWDALGSAWKWLAGNPDADDLRLINTTMNELINGNNRQFQVNNVINNRIKEITTTINEIIEGQSMTNKIILEEIDALTLILYIDTINDILEEIQDTIIRARISLASSKLLTLKEVFHLDSLLQNQGFELEFPEEALNYALPKIVVKNDLLLYILEIPEIDKRSSEIIEIIPLIVNNKVIINIPKYIVRSNKQVFTTIRPEKFVQRYPDIQPLRDNCTYAIIMGIMSHCNAQQTTETQISLISENKLLVNNANKINLTSNCGPDNRMLTGNTLITFYNCSIEIANETFTATEMISQTKDLQGAFHNLRMNWNIDQQQNISTLTNHTLINRKQLDNVKIKQDSHQIWIFSLLGGLSTTTVITITVMIFFCIRRKKIVIKIRSPRNKTMSISEQRNPPRKIKTKVEDALSLPPGGITVDTEDHISRTHIATTRDQQETTK